MKHSRITGGARSALVGLCILGMLGGCAGGRGGCDKPGVYSGSSSGPPLRVPPDLSRPAESSAFEIPAAPPSSAESPPCGHYPPKIASTSPQATPSASDADAAPPTPPPAPAAPTPAPDVALAPAPPPVMPAAPAVVSPDLLEELRALVVSWGESWTTGDFDRYLHYYAQDFDPPGDLTIEEWQTARRGRLDKHPVTTVFADTLTVEEASPERIVVQFVQRSELEGVVSSLRKALVLVREDAAWRIQKESIVEALSNPR